MGLDIWNWWTQLRNRSYAETSVKLDLKINLPVLPKPRIILTKSGIWKCFYYFPEHACIPNDEYYKVYPVGYGLLPKYAYESWKRAYLIVRKRHKGY